MSERVKRHDEQTAPCIFCGYSGEGYFQRGTHDESCPWRNIGGFIERRRAFPLVIENLATQLAAEREKVRERDERIAESKVAEHIETLQAVIREFSDRAESAERDLADAEEAIRLASEQIDVSPTFEDERVSYVEVQMDRGFRAEWLSLPAVRRALGRDK